MALLDLLGRRWALRIIWELRAETLGFRELQQRCGGMSSSVLSDRLRELREAGVLEQVDGRHRMTDEGERLLDLYPPVQAWAERWADRSHLPGSEVRTAQTTRGSSRMTVSPTQKTTRRSS